MHMILAKRDSSKSNIKEITEEVCTFILVRETQEMYSFRYDIHRVKEL